MKLGIGLTIFSLIWILSFVVKFLIPFEPVYLLFGIPYLIIGIIVLIFGIVLIKKSNNGSLKETILTGKYIFHEIKSNNTNSAEFYIIYSCTNQNGRNDVFKTTRTYSLAEVIYFKEKKYFRVKRKLYDNRIFDTISQADLEEINYKLQNDREYRLNALQFDKNNTALAELGLSNYFQCEYCNKIQESPGKCSNCGAIIHKPKNK